MLEYKQENKNGHRTDGRRTDSRRTVRDQNSSMSTSCSGELTKGNNQIKKRFQRYGSWALLFSIMCSISVNSFYSLELMLQKKNQNQNKQRAIIKQI